MPRLCRETSKLKKHAIDSIITAIELFNRPSTTSRTEGVLFFLQHSFEMLLKAVIFQYRRTIHEPRSSVTYGFNKCLGIAQSDLEILSKDEVDTLTILNGFRDCAMHHHLEMSEDSLYLNAQACVTIFDELLRRVWHEGIAEYIPERILPISIKPPEEINVFMDKEFSQIKALLQPGKRQGSEAKARIRPYLIMESVLQGKNEQPSEAETNRIAKIFQEDVDWKRAFPGVSRLMLDTSQNGLTYSVRFTRNPDAAPVRIIRDGEQADEVTLVREVNLLDRYSMNLHQLAEKIGIGSNKALALIYYLGLRQNPGCYKEFNMGSARYKCYSPKALEIIQERIGSFNMDTIYRDYIRDRKR